MIVFWGSGTGCVGRSSLYLRLGYTYIKKNYNSKTTIKQ